MQAAQDQRTRDIDVAMTMRDISGRRRRESSATRRMLAALGAFLVCLWLGATPAVAVSGRAHVFAFAFGSEGEGAGQFRFMGTFKRNDPPGIAVDEASGDVFVVDRANDRVQQFSESGAFIAAFGWGVSDGKEEFEVCKSACQAGLATGGKGGFQEPSAIAIDNSPGGAQTLYVGANGTAKRPDVQTFAAGSDQALGKLTVTEEGRLDGLAVDREGRVWLYRGEEEEAGEIEGFNDASPPVRIEPSLFSSLGCPKPGFGVDAAGQTFYVGHELLTSEGECPAVIERERAQEKEPGEGKYARPIVAGELVEEAFGGTSSPVSELDRPATTGIAVDQASSQGTPLGESARGDAYLAEGSSIARFDADGQLVERFGQGRLDDAMGLAVDAKSGDVYVLDAGQDKVDVFAPNAPGTPVVEDLSAENLSPTEVGLSGRIDPEGADTHYYFQYGTSDCVSDPSGCVDVPAAPGTDLGAGFDGQSVRATLNGLLPDTTYFYRVIASNSLGAADSEGHQQTIRTLPSSSGLLADNRAWEMVSPPEKDGAGIEPLSKEGGLIEASPDGNAISYVANGPVVEKPAGSRAPESTQVMATRSRQGWSSEEMITPHEKAEGIETGEPSEYRFFSEDLALSLVEPSGAGVEPMETPPLALGVSEKTLYLRDDQPIAPSPPEQSAYDAAQANQRFLAPGFAPLVTPANVSAEIAPGEKTRFGAALGFVDATSDLTHVIFESEVPLLAGSAAGLYEAQAGGALELVSMLPDDAPAPTPALGDEGTNVRNAISEDGSRVIFSSESEEGGQAPGLYLHDTHTQQTIQLNAAQGVIEPTGEESEVAFEAASNDDSKVFFTDTAPLTPQSAQRQQQQADLYECEVIESQGKLTCELKDLTPLAGGGSADVLNVIPGISEDGSYVYFVANGVLAPGATDGQCVHQSLEVAPEGATCNLYLWHEDTITFIASLANEDSGDWGSLLGSGRVGNYIENRPDLADVTSRVSPDGEYLAFMSDMPLTGYDNGDANHGNEGARDQEVYLYQASSNRVNCVSCNPHGPSVGVLDTQHAGEGEGLVVDRREDWLGQHLAGSVPGWTPLGVDGATHQPRYLSDSGRLFFDSPDELAPQAANDREDVYEYEPEGIGNCEQSNGCVSLISSGSSEYESAFLEASEDGNDAFFVTAQPLVAADHDSNYDLYDASVCASSSPCLNTEMVSRPACETSSACNPVNSPPPSIQTPATATQSQPPNAPKGQTLGYTQGIAGKPKAKPSRAQLLQKALEVCRKSKNRHKRTVCQAQARRRYGSAHKGNASRRRKTAHQARAVQAGRTGHAIEHDARRGDR